MSETLVVCLRRLCQEHGGRKAVAKVLKVNDQSLYQILEGVKLPSGKPRGIGRTLREKLDKHYPGWLALGLPEAVDYKQTAAASSVARIPAQRSSAGGDHAARETLLRLGELLDAVPPGPQRSAVAGLLSAYAHDPTASQYLDALMALLQPAAAPETTQNRAHG